MRTYILRIKGNLQKGQSLIELALIVPLILLMLLAMVEVGFLIFNYLNAMDLTREAARFASVRDWRSATPGGATPLYCQDPDRDVLDFYKDTACFFVDSTLNANLPFSTTNYSDVTISVFVVVSDTNATVARRLPFGQTDADGDPIDPDGDGVWSQYNDNWKKDCDGNIIHEEPVFSDEDIEAMFLDDAPKAKGLVLVEGYICYDMLLYVPLLSDVVGSPFRIHTYTFMPAPEAIPTPTPIP
jgi:hypothetical protein